jgi:hypothetical protein
MKQILLVLLLCISYTAWASWSSSADDLTHTRSGVSSYPPLIINSDGSAFMIIDNGTVTAYGRAPNSNWNLIGELLISDPILSDYADFSNFAHSSSLERFALCKDQTSQYDSEAGTSQNIPAKITVLNFTNSVWSANEFSLPQKYSRIDDIGMSKNGNRIAIKTTSNDNHLGYSEILVYENILGSWIPVGEPINIGYIYNTNGIRLDENGDSLIIGLNAYNDDSQNFTYISPVKVYTYSYGSWNQKGQKIYPSEDFDAHGFAVDISDDGQRIAISSPYFNSGGKVDSGRVDIYQFANNEWQHITNIDGEDAGDLFGRIFFFSDNGNRIAISSDLHDNDSGHIRVFDFDSSSYDYLQIGNDINGLEYDSIGYRFAMSGDGTTIISMVADWVVQIDLSGVFTETLKTYSYGAPTDESLDSDGDGLTNATELSLGTNPNLVDTDSDGFPDGWEVSRNLDPTINSSDFISNINAYGYYSTEQISDLRPGSTMIEVENGQATLSMEVEQSDDLEIWTSGGTTNLQVPIDPNSDTKFFRFKMAE